MNYKIAPIRKSISMFGEIHYMFSKYLGSYFKHKRLQSFNLNCNLNGKLIRDYFDTLYFEKLNKCVQFIQLFNGNCPNCKTAQQFIKKNYNILLGYLK